MNQEMPDSELIRMALGAKAKVSSNPEKWDVLEFDPASLERFARLIAANTLSNIDPSKLMSFQEGLEAGRVAEREECAKVCDAVGDRDTDTHAYDCAIAIRRRGEHYANSRPWVGLTDEERSELWWNTDMNDMPEHDYGKAIEAKLKEKNT